MELRELCYKTPSSLEISVWEFFIVKLATKISSTHKVHVYYCSHRGWKKKCGEIKKFIRLSVMLIGGMEGTYGALIRSEWFCQSLYKRLHRLRWFGHVQRMEESRFPKRVLYMNLETTRPRGRPRNRWLDEVREDGKMIGGEEWQEKVYDREEWKRLLRTARNHRILHMPMEWLIDWLYTCPCYWECMRM